MTDSPTIPPKEFHFYASSICGWATDEDLFVCLKKQYREDMSDGRLIPTSCFVWKVPLPASANYKINNYVPVVDGIQLIDEIKYPKRRKRK